MMAGESEAVGAFERLGLTSYEAKVFIALQRLGSGTARDVARVADVPRSQVYSVAESLEDRGLLEVQQSTPIRYRPVGIEEARETLRARFESEQERAFEYVEGVREESDTEERQEDIWTVRGRDRIDDRVFDVLSGADERVVFGVRRADQLAGEIGGVLEELAAEGVEVTVISRSSAIRDRVEEFDGVATIPPADDRADDEVSGRIVIVDDDSVLLSVVDADGGETAIWSAGSLFASVLIRLVEANTEAPMG
ncbi:TrmB family transcriptional regulator [Saliphagus sp. LR7]|uniref:TrmB family transcriptional regulator n=1 Tax=Saliphagus sp. LR7 TaxID=2282654 RepID=UPI000DF7A375|nr:helix-turn-helix domain-containing protein [Saliphagus sp. LR7]